MKIDVQLLQRLNLPDSEVALFRQIFGAEADTGVNVDAAFVKAMHDAGFHYSELFLSMFGGHFASTYDLIWMSVDRYNGFVISRLPADKQPEALSELMGRAFTSIAELVVNAAALETR